MSDVVPPHPNTLQQSWLPGREQERNNVLWLRLHLLTGEVQRDDSHSVGAVAAYRSSAIAWKRHPGFEKRNQEEIVEILTVFSGL